MQIKLFKTAIFLMLAVSVFYFLGCSSPHLSENESIGILLPSTYEGKEVCTWNIKYCCNVKEHKQTYATNKVFIPLKKNEVSAVLAYPTFAQSEQQATPLGLIYPYSLQLNQKDGFTSLILYELYSEPELQVETVEKNVKLFNWQKLMEACREYDNPWLLQEDRIKKAIKKGSFKKSDIKLKKKK